MQYYVIDAFTETRFGGNPAGVVLHHDLNEDFMQKFASEVRFSETAFIKKIDDLNFEIRYFTPNSEVDLCGHATIASFKALLDSKLIKDNNKYFIKTLAGILPVYINNSFIMMEQAKPKLGKIFNELGTFSQIFNISKEDIGDVKFDLMPQAVSTGLWDIILPVKSKDSLFNLNPDFKELANFSRENDVVGVHAFTLDGNNSDAVCRNFAPLYGIDEEAATGTSNGALTYYLFNNKVIHELDRNYTFLQGESMGRPSQIITRLTDQDDPKVMVGGKAVILTKGEII